jgi:hypothetical protein
MLFESSNACTARTLANASLRSSRVVATPRGLDRVPNACSARARQAGPHAKPNRLPPRPRVQIVPTDEPGREVWAQPQSVSD